MHCEHCGTENDNIAKFCKGCGKALNAAASSPVPESKPVKKVNKPSSKLPYFALGGAALVIALIITIIVKASAVSIDLNKYLTIESSGYNGYGTAKTVIDWSAIEEKYGKKLSFSKHAKEEYGSFLSLVTPIDIMQECVSVKLEETNGLSNGDQVAYTWNVDSELSETVNCKVKYKDDTYKVADLKEVDVFDVFDDIIVEFSGVAPNGCAILSYLGTEFTNYDFIFNQDMGLSNGDTITLTLDSSKVEECALKTGKVPESLTKEYVVEGLCSYISEVKQISDEALDAMKKQAEDVYLANVAKNWGDNETLQNLSYIGNYLLTTKNEDSSADNNMFYLVYKIQVRNQYEKNNDSYDKINDIYWFIAFDNLMLDTNNELVVDITTYRTPKDTFYISSGIGAGWFTMAYRWKYYGYSSLEELYNSAVTSYLDKYNHEDDIDTSIADTVVAETEETAAADYILPESNTTLLTNDDLKDLTADELKLARNEIYARHGRKFQDETLQAHFNSLSWYEGTVEPGDFKESVLSDIEIANKDLIVSYEEKINQ